MGCNFPRPAWPVYDRRTGKHRMQLTKAKPLEIRNEGLLLPCNECTGCALDKNRGWALRCYLEAQQHHSSIFITLTYDEEHNPLQLVKRDLQLWFKRYRKTANRPIRHYSCGEYGEYRQRAHYHALVFGGYEEDNRIIAKTWGMGRTQIEPISPGRIAYVTGYTRKKVEQRRQEQWVTDPDTGEYFERLAPFTLQSRGGRTGKGIGHHAREQYATAWKDYAVANGHRMPVPRYLHEGWRTTATEEEIQTNKDERAARAQEHALTLAMLKANEAIQLAKQKLDAAKRRY